MKKQKGSKENTTKVGEAIDYSKVKNQTGCGYCFFEDICQDKDTKINKAKQGCKQFSHFSRH